MACHQQAQQYLGAVKLPVLGIPRAPQVVRVRSLEVQRRDVVEDNVNAPAGGSGTVRERDLLDAVLYAPAAPGRGRTACQGSGKPC